MRFADTSGIDRKGSDYNLCLGVDTVARVTFVFPIVTFHDPAAPCCLYTKQGDLTSRGYIGGL